MAVTFDPMDPGADIVPATPAQQKVSDLGDILKAAPELKMAPGIAVALASYGGTVTDNAQSVVGVARGKAMDTATDRLNGDVGPMSDAMREKAFVKANPEFGGSGVLGNIEHLGSDIVNAPDAIRHQTAAATDALGSSIKATGLDVKGMIDQQRNALNTRVASQGLAGGFASGVGSGIAQQANAIATEPSHVARMVMDVNARHGPAAAALSLVPIIGGAGLGFLVSHSPEGTEEGATAGADLFGAEVKADANGEIIQPTAAQTAGQTARTVARTAGKVVAAPLRGALKVNQAISTAPAAVGAEGAGIASGKILYPASWQRTANASTWLLPDGKHGPTLGREVAGLVGLEKGTDPYNILSGAIDGFMQVGAPDPLGAGGRVLGKARSAEGFGDSFLGRYWGGTVAKTPADVDRVLTQYPSRARAIKDMAGMSAGEIADKYPAWAELAPRLAKAETYQDKVDIFKDTVRTQELHTTPGMPTLGRYKQGQSALRDSDLGLTRLATPQPMAYDEELRRFETQKFTMGDPKSVPPIMAMLRGAGEDLAVVHQVGDDLLATADPRVWNMTAANAMKDLLGRRALSQLSADAPPELSNAITKSIEERVNEYFGVAGAGHTGEMGADQNGGDLSIVYNNPDDPEDMSRAAALWFPQAGAFTIPTQRTIAGDIAALERMVRSTAKNWVLTKGYPLEEFIDEYLNQKWFQPLALGTPAFGVRVSLSEMALNVSRLGPLRFTASMVADSAARQGWKLTDTEIHALPAVIHGILAGVGEAAVYGLNADDLLDAAVASQKMFDGMTVHPALDPTHAGIARNTDLPEGTLTDIKGAMHRQGLGPKLTGKLRNMKLSDVYTQIGPGQTGYARSWSDMAGLIGSHEYGTTIATAYRDALTLGKDETGATADAIAAGKQYLDSLPENDITHMTRHYARSQSGIAMGLSPHEDWARQSTSALKGILYGQDGTFHPAMLRDIIDRTVPDTKGIMERYGNMDPASLPQRIPGRELSHKTTNIVERLSNLGHTHIMGPMMNHLSREPTWNIDFAGERKLLKDKVAAGEMSQDQADVLAADRAVRKTIRFVHNPLDRLKIENMLHIVAPFYFAQNQAIRRSIRLLQDNPGAFEQYMKLLLGANTWAAKITAKNGEPYGLIPGSTIAGRGISNVLHTLGIDPVGSVPIGLLGGVDVSSTINPLSTSAENDPSGPLDLSNAFKPSPGIVAALPLKGIQMLFSQRAPGKVATDLLGPIGASESFWQQAIPNSLLAHIAEGAGGWSAEEFTDSSISGSYTTATLDALQNAVTKLTPAQVVAMGSNPQAKAEFIKQINNTTAINWAGRTLVASTFPTSVILSAAGLKFTDLAQSYINKAGGNITVGLDKMSAQHPDLVPYEVFKSSDPDGYSYPTVQKTGEWISANKSLVNNYPSVAGLLMPRVDAKGKVFSDSAYQMELAMGLRKQDTPQQFLDQIYIQSGDAYYYDVLKPAITKALAEHPNDSSWAYTIYSKADQVEQNYGTTLNPTWWTAWQADTAVSARQNKVGELKKMLADPATPKSTLTTNLGYLVNFYYQFQADTTNPRSPIEPMSTSQRKAYWDAEMAEAVKQYPDTKQAVNSVFLGLGG